MRSRGKNLPRSHVNMSPAHVGELTVSEVRDHVLARPVTCARLIELGGTEVDVLPQLTDVRLLWVRRNEMRLTGLERVDETDVAQAWVVEVL